MKKFLSEELTEGQVERLSEFCANLGLIFFASTVAPIFSGVDNIEPTRVLFGWLLTTISLIISLLLAKGNKK